MNTTPNDQPAGSDDVPARDQPDDAVQPETQGTEPVEAELGDEGQGDLAPEDLAEERPDEDSEARATPQDLRTEPPTETPVESSFDTSSAMAGDQDDPRNEVIGDSA